MSFFAIGYKEKMHHNYDQGIEFLSGMVDPPHSSCEYNFLPYLDEIHENKYYSEGLGKCLNPLDSQQFTFASPLWNCFHEETSPFISSEQYDLDLLGQYFTSKDDQLFPSGCNSLTTPLKSKDDQTSMLSSLIVADEPLRNRPRSSSSQRYLKDEIKSAEKKNLQSPIRKINSLPDFLGPRDTDFNSFNNFSNKSYSVENDSFTFLPPWCKSKSLTGYDNQIIFPSSLKNDSDDTNLFMKSNLVRGTLESESSKKLVYPLASQCLQGRPQISSNRSELSQSANEQTEIENLPLSCNHIEQEISVPQSSLSYFEDSHFDYCDSGKTYCDKDPLNLYSDLTIQSPDINDLRSRSHRSENPLACQRDESPSPKLCKRKSSRNFHVKKKQSNSTIDFVNYTQNDSLKILTGVAPSGSGKTKARRDKEALEKRHKLSQAAKKAVLDAGGNVESLVEVEFFIQD